MPSPPSNPRLPGGFLTLAPTTSSSYPRLPTEDSTSSSPTTTSESCSASPSRRCSSTSASSSSSIGAYKFLKLGPVHWGEHLDGEKGDFFYLDDETTPAS
ncbi:hypothetical protein L249_1286 [Ophiocordyceps polyrhachis-furcata BCC 54312]|uniref:Uncharacterized protein n=1 Tax=Ophiocordyceps polyrhachis-furcata BCC 54312 TaxID=1330021 RepID=A0A367LFC2_9HYPO|nr:hypothetical protein L249_1286 [Ophiocordyceps polyrhachis-furcata BCC 54312]